MVDRPDNTNESQEEEEVQPQPAILVLNPNPDGMVLELTFQKAIDAPTIPPTYEQVMDALTEKKVVYGINEAGIQAVCQTTLYGRPFTVAKGKEPKTGENGYLHYLVKTSRELRPKLREDGTADYRDIGFIHNVAKDQPLCEIHLETKGEDGCDIYGNVREGRWGQKPFNPKGRNTYLNEEGTMLYASCDGSVEVLRSGLVEVVDTLKVSGNVDNSTGDINFPGDVIIAGDVISGFRITSQGSVTVKGSVEGAFIDAAGDIIVGMGINGMNRGSIVVGGSLKCRYIQSIYIKAGGDIYADTIMYCNIECGGSVELNGKRATLIGGRASIANKLIAKTIGTESHVATYIIMASTGVEKQQEMKALEEEIKVIDGELRKLMQLLARYEDLIKQGRLNAEQVKTVMAVKDSYLSTAGRREEAQQKLEQAKKEQLEASYENSYIECKNRVHVGTHITFGPLVLKVNNSFVNSRVGIVDDDIRIMTL